MADLKISQLTSASTPLAGTEILPVNQSGTTTQVSVANLTAGRSVSASGLTTTGSSGVSTQLINFNNYVTLTNTFGIYATYSEGTVVSGYSGFNVSFAINGSLKGYFQQANGDFVNTTGNFVPITAAKGVNFTANTPASGMTSQLLNWYEEGTFTPSFIADTTNPTVTYTTQSGKYTRIGNMVNFTIGLVVNTVSGGSGTLRVAGLPFVNGSGLPWSANRTFVYSWATNPTVFQVPNGSNAVLIYTSDVTNTTATPASLQNGCYFYISGMYRVS